MRPPHHHAATIRTVPTQETMEILSHYRVENDQSRASGRWLDAHTDYVIQPLPPCCCCCWRQLLWCRSVGCWLTGWKEPAWSCSTAQRRRNVIAYSRSFISVADSLDVDQRSHDWLQWVQWLHLNAASAHGPLVCCCPSSCEAFTLEIAAEDGAAIE